MTQTAELTHTESLKYGILEVEDWNKLAPIFEAQGAQLPDPAVATCAVATDEEKSGKIVAFHMLQVAYHAEPMWIDPEYRARVNYQTLLGQLEQLFFIQQSTGEYYAFCPTPEIEAMAIAAGLKDTGWKVYKKSL